MYSSFICLETNDLRCSYDRFKKEFKEDLDLSKSNFTISDAEDVKISLSSLSEKKVTIVAEGHPKHVFTITRKEFEAEISSLLTQMKMTCENILTEADRDISKIQEIFLAGGSSRIPIVQDMLEKFLGKKPSRTFIGFSYNSEGYSDHLPIILQLTKREL